MSVYKLRGAGTGGSENDIASLDIQFDGDIVGMHLTGTADLDADNEGASCEISFLSASTAAVNDARGSLLTVSLHTSETATGKSESSASSGIGGIRVPVSAGERVHMHCESNAGVTSTWHGYLYVNDTADESLRRRR